MKKTKLLICYISFGLILLTSCSEDSNKLETSYNNGEKITINSDKTEQTKEPSQSMFRIDMQVPKTIKVGDSFEVKGFLINTSNTVWSIFHGADIFTYAIYDNKGELIPRHEDTIAVNDIGISTTLKPNSKYKYDGQEHVSTKLYKLTVNKPGEYKIIGQAEFNINYNNKDYEFQIKSEPQEIIVKK
ncbi:hypothetical protein G5B47_13750 [Paenibacillus sp. 7124]|uniref:Uncharacterized protein n=1 Tax=Paenibacillus apii TaxID=1850370 RepID=A0A6M1PTB2_9BACL|nr:hypothetical protein [Paenibacillus apii]NGM83481.1 hypothetical protein [Paenibacillus apii]